jgi:hypothetical protein
MTRNQDSRQAPKNGTPSPHKYTPIARFRSHELVQPGTIRQGKADIPTRC